MKRYAEQNWKYFKETYPALSEKIQEKRENPVENVWTEKLANGEEVIVLRRNNRDWYLNSRIDPIKAAQIYSDRYPTRIYLNYMVFGFGDGKHIRKMLENCDETNKIIVFEPCTDIFIESMDHFMLTDILKDKRFAIYFMEISEEINSLIKLFITEALADLIEFCILPGYDILFPESCEHLMEEIQISLHEIRMYGATRRVGRREITQNVLFHMKKMIVERNINQIKERLTCMDISDIPAFIVSAGPSLDKNINDLKKAEGKSLIVVVDAAVRTLINAGIRPDLIVTVDAKTPNKFFEGIELDGLNWICASQTRPWILKQFNGNVFYYGSFSSEWDNAVKEELGYPIKSMDVGGSVSTVAFALLIYFGFKKIILVGQDLAFTGGKSHTIGAFDAIGDSKEYIGKRALVEVEGIDGEKLKTDAQMFMYKIWFERAIEKNKDDIVVIDATEGGAKIRGAENMKLKDVVEECCTDEIDMFGLIHEIEPQIDQRGRENLYKRLEDMKDGMLDFKEKLNDKIEVIEELKDEFSAKKGDQKKEKDILQKLKKINEEIEKENMLEWLQLYASMEEHDLLENIYKDEEINGEELIEKTLQTYRAYYEKIEIFFEDYEEYVA